MNFYRLLFLSALLAILAGCAGGPPQKSEQAEKTNQLIKQAGYTDRYLARDTSRTVDLTHPPIDAWDRIRRGFAIPNMDTVLTQQWTDYYASHPESVRRMSERAGKYLYYIIEEINRRGLPSELALLPFVESAYDPAALSHANASGLWQFIPTTGEHFNLRQDWWRDERRDPVASTNAALDYLEYLFDLQGDWYLALASYNWGEGSVKRATERNAIAGQPTDYLSLSMPDETRNYVPKLQAIKNIIADPQKYGVDLPKVSNAPYFVTVRKNQDMDVELVAKMAEMPLDDFKALNPSFNRPIIRGEHAANLLLPADRVSIFNTNIQAYKGQLTTWKVYHAKPGESYAAIAKSHGVSVATLRRINDLPARPRTGKTAQTMLVPGSENIHLVSLESPQEALASLAPDRARAVVAVPTGKRAAPRAHVRVHRVKRGDTLFSIARHYDTSVSALRALNNMRGTALAVGARLRIPGTEARG